MPAAQNTAGMKWQTQKILYLFVWVLKIRKKVGYFLKEPRVNVTLGTPSLMKQTARILDNAEPLRRGTFRGLRTALALEE